MDVSEQICTKLGDGEMLRRRSERKGTEKEEVVTVSYKVGRTPGQITRSSEQSKPLHYVTF